MKKSQCYLYIVMDCDIVSTSRQHLEKFIRELHELTTHVKILYSSLYPSIILENNLAPNTQIGRIVIEDQNDPSKIFSLNEHPDMYSSDDDDARYSRGGEFLENLISGNPLEFCRRWMMLGDVHQVIDDIKEFYKFNGYTGKSIDYQFKDAVYFVKNTSTMNSLEFYDNYMMPPVVLFENTIDADEKKRLTNKIKEGALL